MSSNSSPSRSRNAGDAAQEFEQFLAQLSIQPEKAQIVSELGGANFASVPKSIYGEESVRIWHPSQSEDHRHSKSEEGTAFVRYELQSTLPPYENMGTTIRVLVSLPSYYPTSSPPQLQLLSRYIGPFGVDAMLFGSILRTFISKDGIQWTPDTLCVFDGMENVRERCAKWFAEHLSEEKAGETLREDAKGKGEEIVRKQEQAHHSARPEGTGYTPPLLSSMPEGVNIIEADAITDRKSVFIGRACRISDPSQVSVILSHLMSDRRMSRAAHPIINAWRCKLNGVLHQDNDDDGETAAGGRLAHLLQILDVENVLVIVTRYFGGIHLGPDRFKHINQAARNALEQGGFLDVPEKSKISARVKKRT